MRWVLYGVLVIGSAFLGYDRLAGPAYAVMPESSAATLAPIPTQASVRATVPTEAPASVRLDLPVSWQLTRSKLMGPGAATMTESFRETWTLEVSTTGRIFLISPRARVPAFVDDSHPRSTTTEIPQGIVLSERDLAKLVGIKASGDADDQQDLAAEAVGRPVTLLLRQTRGGLDVSLAWSEEEHFAVHLDIGGNSVF